MAIKFIKREAGLILQASDLPQPDMQEQIDTSSQEWINYETKTGDYAPAVVGEQYYCLRDKRSNLITDLKKHTQHGYESILSTDSEFQEYITRTGAYGNASSDDTFWARGFNAWFIKAYLQKEYEGNSTLMDDIRSAMMP